MNACSVGVFLDTPFISEHVPFEVQEFTLRSNYCYPVMARLRRDTQDTQPFPQLHRHLRIVASGTLFLTHTLSLPTHPSPSTVIRAHSVTKTRGGAASTCLSILAQFPGVEAMLVASLGNNDEGRMIINQLEQEGVSTKHSKIWEDANVPSAWVLHSGSWSYCSWNPQTDTLTRLI
jgi:hypothetical protein